MSSPAPAVLVMAAAPSAARPGAPLDAWLGPDRARRLHAALLRRAAGWAARAAPGAAFVAFDPAAARDEVAALLPPGVDCFAQAAGSHGERTGDAVRRVMAHTGAPVLIVGTNLPALSDYHADAAHSDMRAGCEVVLGVSIGGGLYLLGVRSPQPELFALLGAEHDGETTRRHARRVTDGRLQVGMLHYERALATPQDARAMLADPLLPADVADALRA